jgi:hypothetical protein
LAVFPSNPHPFLTSHPTGAGDDHRPHSSSKSAFNDLLSIPLERAVRKIHADINDVVRFFHCN